MRSQSHLPSLDHFNYAGCLKKLYNDIPDVTVRRELRKRLHSKAHKLSIVRTMNKLYAFKCKRLRNTRRTVTFGIPLQSFFF
jgi:hypothetical protein